MVRNKQILIKVTETEKEYIYKKAVDYGITVSHMIRLLLVGEKLPKPMKDRRMKVS